MSLSAIILTKNSQDTIVDCIESVNFCDEIIIVDDYSTDNTIDLVTGIKNKKIKLVRHHLNDDFSAQRNYALSKSSLDWLLFVDSDEVISEKLHHNIERAVESNFYNGYLVKRVDFLWGTKLLHGEAAGVTLLRLAKKGVGKWEGKVHETWKVRGKVSRLDGELLHYSHKSIYSFVSKINKYTTIRAFELHKLEVNVSLFHIVLYPFGKFLDNFLIKKGFIDREAGFIHASLMSFHSFLVRSKLYLLQKGISKNLI